MKKANSWVMFLIGLLLGVVSVYFIFKWVAPEQSGELSDLLAGILSAVSGVGLILKEIRNLVGREPAREKDEDQGKGEIFTPKRNDKQGIISNVISAPTERSRINQQINFNSPKQPRSYKVDPHNKRKKTKGVKGRMKKK